MSHNVNTGPRFGLRELGLLEGSDEPEFDAIVELTTAVMNCEIAAVSFIDEQGQSQFFKAHSGLPDPWAQDRKVPLSHSYCVHVRDTDTLLEISDARQTGRFSNHPAATDLGLVAYLGCPLHGPAADPVGAICVISQEPRIWSDRDRQNIQRLARLATSQILLRAALRTVNILSRFNDEAASRQLPTRPLHLRD